MKLPEFKVFIDELNPQQFQEWADYTQKQKNMERIIENTLNSLVIVKEFEV